MFKETANIIIKGYFEEYPAELEKLKNAESVEIFNNLIYETEDAIKSNLEESKYEFGDLLTLLLRETDREIDSEFGAWFGAFDPDASDLLAFIKDPYDLIYLLLCDSIGDYDIEDVLLNNFGVEPPKPPKPTDSEILQKINNFCLVHENISKADILRVLGGAKNE